jgi:hypothetical protein
LVTNDHFSSNWTSCVAGGKSHEFVVELPGVLAGPQAVADDGVLVHADQASGLADADPFGDMAQDGHDFVRGELGAEQRGALALGEAGLAGLTAEQAALLGAVAHGDGQVAVTAPAVVGAVRILAAEDAQVVRLSSFLAHGSPLLGIHRSSKLAQMLHRGTLSVQ